MVFRSTVAVHPIQQFRDEVDRLVTGALANPAIAGATRLVTGRGFPAVNVWEDREHLFVEAEVPGLTADQLDIAVVNDELTIKGERREKSEPQVAYHRRERGVGSFTRVLRLGSEVNAERVQATLSDGVLLLTLPKADAAKPRKVEVKSQ